MLFYSSLFYVYSTLLYAAMQVLVVSGNAVCKMLKMLVKRNGFVPS